MSMSRRPRSALPRDDRVTTKLNKEEKAAVHAAAVRAGLGDGAWVGKTAVRAANLQEMPASQAQLETLRELVTIAELSRKAVTLLKHASINQTGSSGPVLASAVAFLLKVMARADDAVITAKRRPR